MNKRQEYRDFAATCLDMAQKTETVKDALVLLEMAVLWFRLAERVAATQSEPTETA